MATEEDRDPCFAGESECSALMRGLPWAATPLGPSRLWPRTLRTLVPVMLASRFAMRILWGPELILLYNDEYRSVLGPRKHPAAMGRPIEESYLELWQTVGPIFARVLGGEAVSLDDGILPLNRSGYLEECYFTLSYSPIADEEGAVRGVLGVIQETTERVLAERRLLALRGLAADLVDVTSVDAACEKAGRALVRNGADVPFALFYVVVDDDQRQARLVATAGLDGRPEIAPATIALGGEGSPWPVGLVGDGRVPVIVTDVARRCGDVQAGPFPEPITSAIVLPLTRQGSPRPRAFIVAGVNPRHALDDKYQTFFELVAEHVGKAIFNVLAWQEERRTAQALAVAAQDAERAALAERGRLYELFMQAPMPVAIFRGDALVVELANDATLLSWGKDRAIVGRAFDLVFAEASERELASIIRGVLETGVAYRGSEVVSHRERGAAARADVFWNFVFAPLLESGVVTGVLLCGFEVTDQVVARRRVERLAEELAQQKTALEAAHRMKDEFVATMSHELRTPLNAILGWTRMMKAGRVAPGRVSHALETIERNAVAQTALVEDLLDVSRILTGKLRLNVESVDMPRVIEAAIDTMRPASDARGIQLHAVIDSHAGPVMGDPDRLSQIVSNLFSNAVKFSTKGGRVHVHLERVSSVVRLTVKDNGVGIRPEFLPFVFDRFRQADQTMTRRHGGLGLGLSIVKHLVELHGGTITAESEGADRGATFAVTLPLSAVDRAGVPGHSALPVPASRELDGLRVLVVDDELDARELIAEILSYAGVDVRMAASADEAMREMEAFAPHILVCDIGMPGEDGYSLMQRIRALPADRGGRVRAAAVTAYTRGDDRRRALAVGFNLHISKPVDPSELIVSVARLAERYTPPPP